MRSCGRSLLPSSNNENKEETCVLLLFDRGGLYSDQVARSVNTSETLQIVYKILKFNNMAFQRLWS